MHPTFNIQNPQPAQSPSQNSSHWASVHPGRNFNLNRNFWSIFPMLIIVIEWCYHVSWTAPTPRLYYQRCTEVVVEVDLLRHCTCRDDGKDVGDQQIGLLAFFGLADCQADAFSCLCVSSAAVNQRRMISVHVVVLTKQDKTFDPCRSTSTDCLIPAVVWFEVSGELLKLGLASLACHDALLRKDHCLRPLNHRISTSVIFSNSSVSFLGSRLCSASILELRI